MIAALTALLLATPVPTPIGVGPRYRPAPAPLTVRRGRPLGRFSCAHETRRYGVHVELFANGRVVVVPGGIGVAGPLRQGLSRIEPRGCTYPARTLTPTGIVEVARGSRLTLADLFRIWGQSLGPHRLGGFRFGGRLLAFVDGRRWHGDPGRIPLVRHAEIVLELGGFVPPHASFLFPGGL